MKSMVNSAQNDTENILVTWIADFDASQFAESSGYVTALGEWDVTTRGWYTQVQEAGDVILTEPYMNSSTNSLVISVISPVWSADGSDMLGVAGVDLTLAHLQEVVSAMTFGETGRLVLASETGMIISGLESSEAEQNVSDIYGQEAGARMSGGNAGAVAFRYQGASYEGCAEPVGSTGWSMMSVMTEAEYSQDYVFVKSIIIAVFALV